MSKKNPKVDLFLKHAPQWKEEFEKLRKILLQCDLGEDIKWGQPCYLFQGKNVVLLHGFKEYCALLFFKGALLKDPQDILIQQTEKVQGPRQIRFTGLRDIVGKETILKSYVEQAIEVEKSGGKVQLKGTADVAVPEEFQKKLDAMPGLKAAFAELTPGRQRAYLYFFSGAKQSKTREARVEKCMQQILDGKGLDD